MTHPFRRAGKPLLHQRKQRPAHEVPGELLFRVAAVFPPGLAFFTQIRLQFLPRNVQQRADQFGIAAERPVFLHSAQAGQAGAAQQRQQYGLRLVAALMRGQDRAGAKDFRHFSQAGVPAVPPRLFQTGLLPRGSRRDILPEYAARDRQPPAELRAECRVLSGLFPQTVVHMHGPQTESFGHGQFFHQKKQADRIAAAAQSDQIKASRSQEAFPADPFRQCADRAAIHGGSR